MRPGSAIRVSVTCAGDEALRREVESLLAEEAGMKSFLETPALELVRKMSSEDPDQSVIGSQLGSYDIVSLLGKGGMGEVYRARDTKLRREVALKILPRAFSRDPERLARFEREAQLLASLNHRNIAAIYGKEDAGEVGFLVLELVEGETLAERIERQGPLPVKEALRLCRQVAEGLEAAHKKPITHRHIKPANIKVTPEGEVKILDFGLAKAFDGKSVDLSQSPTLSPDPTREGQIVGTPAYMSPEQVRGQDVDKRTDIWAFGCLLYELLTGQSPFQSHHPSRDSKRALAPPDTPADNIAAVLEQEPDWQALPASTPVNIRTLLRRCLQKDADRRLHDIADARIEIEEALTAPASDEATTNKGPARTTRKGGHWALVSGLACLLVVALAVGVGIWNLRAPAPGPVVTSAITLPPNVALTNLDLPEIALSPDGSHLAYVASRGGTSQIFLRALDRLESKPLEGTEGAITPFFSPDGQWLGFFAGNTLKKISVAGGASVTLGNVVGTPYGASWGANNTIAFGAAAAFGLWQVSAAGGTVHSLTKIDTAKGENQHRWPQLLPGGKAMLFTIYSPGAPTSIAVQQLETGERKVLIRGGTYPHYVRTGHLAYVWDGTLMAAPFDLKRLELTGTAVPVVEGVRQSVLGGAQFSLSDQGSLVYIPGGAPEVQSNLVWVDRKGGEQLLPAPPRPYRNPRLSPDGRVIAVDAGPDIWVYDIPHGTLSRVTFGGTSSVPLWSPDGKRILFRSARDGKPPNLFWKAADGSGEVERLTSSEHMQYAASWSPDGQVIASHPDQHRGELV